MSDAVNASNSNFLRLLSMEEYSEEEFESLRVFLEKENIGGAEEIVRKVEKMIFGLPLALSFDDFYSARENKESVGRVLNSAQRLLDDLSELKLWIILVLANSVGEGVNVDREDYQPIEPLDMDSFDTEAFKEANPNAQSNILKVFDYVQGVEQLKILSELFLADSPVPVTGRPTKWAILDDLIGRIAEVWKKEDGKWPGRRVVTDGDTEYGPFLNFVHMAIEPVLSNPMSKTTLAGHLKKGLKAVKPDRDSG